jgi:hypothetical protein
VLSRPIFEKPSKISDKDMYKDETFILDSGNSLGNWWTLKG